MAVLSPREAAILELIRSLPEETVRQVEEYARALRDEAAEPCESIHSARASEPAFQRVWNNDEDAVYDDLPLR